MYSLARLCQQTIDHPRKKNNSALIGVIRAPRWPAIGDGGCERAGSVGARDQPHPEQPRPHAEHDIAVLIDIV
jgi:hypothetical protein